MKLAIVSHNFVKGDGQGRVLYEIVKEALRQHADVTLVANRVDQELLDAGASLIPVFPLMSRPLLLKVRDFVRKTDPIVRELRSCGSVVVGNGFTMRSAHDVNIAHMVHGIWLKVASRLNLGGNPLRRRYQNLYTRANATWEKQAFRAARRVVAVSQLVRDGLTAIGVGDERIEVIANGVDIEEFSPGEETREALGLPQNTPLAIFVGDLRSPLKNLDVILSALSSVPSLHVAIVGDRAGSPYPEKAAGLGVAERSQFLGRRSDVAALMRASDFCVFPSHCDAFGLVVLEAMACGLPVIASRAAGASQLVSPECGVVLDPNDQVGWTSALAEFAHRPERLGKMGRASRAVAESHTWAGMAKQYMAVFETVRPA